MLGKCTRKMMLRWSILTVACGYLGILVFKLVENRMPVASMLVVSPPHDKRLLPLELTRLVDPLVMVLPICILVFVAMNLKAISRKLRMPVAERATTCMVCGIIFGIFGSIVIPANGFAAILYGCVASCTVILWSNVTLASDNKDYSVLWHGFMTHVVAVITIWLLVTGITGSVAGFIYAFATLLLAAVLHFGVIGICFLGLVLYRAFVKTMFTCNVA